MGQIDVAKFQIDVAHAPAIVLVETTEEVAAVPGLTIGREDVKYSEIAPFLELLWLAEQYNCGNQLVFLIHSNHFFFN